MKPRHIAALITLALVGLLGWTSDDAATWAPIVALVVVGAVGVAVQAAEAYVERVGPENTTVDEWLDVLDGLDDDEVSVVIEWVLERLDGEDDE